MNRLRILFALGLCAAVAGSPAWAAPRGGKSGSQASPQVSRSNAAAPVKAFSGGASKVSGTAAKPVRPPVARVDNAVKDLAVTIGRNQRNQAAAKNRARQGAERNDAINKTLQQTGDKRRDIRCQTGAC